MKRSTLPHVVILFALTPWPAFAATDQVSGAWLQSLLISAFFIAPLIAVSFISRMSPALPEPVRSGQQIQGDDLDILFADIAEPLQTPRQSAIEVVVRGEPKLAPVIRPRHKPRHAA
ncbi:MAG: hypothetical protein CMI00_02035 [Oceanospirillaceae bacterium]|nr:hypothetical protein [Oceanospirillaceae bacterium]|tara:strand:+ start:1398 stop:1748 length:351 start_codon:yes stop_codon:yes gene_type:complete